MPDQPNDLSHDLPFDRVTLRARRQRLAVDPQTRDADFLHAEAAMRLADRQADIRRGFTQIIELGGRRGLMAQALKSLPQNARNSHYIVTDSAPGFAKTHTTGVVADEEYLPFGPQTADLVLSNLTLHHVNDLPGTLSQIIQIMKPDGLFLAVMLGGDSLAELRACMVEAESRVTGGVYPRFSPLADLRQAAALLQRAGFALPVADAERVTVRYQEPWRLLADLRAMGESNIRRDRSRLPLRREVLGQALTLYQERFAGADGRVPASFDLIFLTGWRPDASQQQPKRPGSATTRLATALSTQEHQTEDVVAPQPQTRHSRDDERS
ncbi:MAG: methyltransferase domain-containing protein [Pseudomonadota bacterium]